VNELFGIRSPKSVCFELLLSPSGISIKIHQKNNSKLFLFIGLFVRKNTYFDEFRADATQDTVFTHNVSGSPKQPFNHYGNVF